MPGWRARSGASSTWARGSRLAFNINMSLNLLFMIIIGGMGSLLGAYFGAAFIVLLPILLNQLPGMFGVQLWTWH
jgi:branched-chain amino acid transport system permease protein